MKNVYPKAVFVPYEEYKIHCNYAGDMNNPKVLLIHASSGYWFDFKNIFSDESLHSKYCIIFYDRPGYGKTTVPALDNL